MPTRERNRYVWYGPGFAARKITTNPVLIVSNPQDSSIEAKWWGRCNDTVGEPQTDHPLTITERDNRAWPPLNGFLDQGGGSYVEYDNFLPSGMDLVSHLSSSIPSIGARATTLRARTNPSREEVSIPNFIHELKDFPRMIKQIQTLPTLARNLRYRHSAGFREAASLHLGFEFGWKPLISDLQDILSFQSLVDKRILELNRLYSEKGLKRRMNLYDDTREDKSTVVAQSGQGVFIRAEKLRVTRIRSWGTIRWRPTAVPHDIGRQDLGRVARKLVFGLQHRGIDGLQAWNALPFSWLADWFSNFGEWLAANRNVVPAAPSGPCNIMTLRETYVTWRRTDSYREILTGLEGVRILRTKERAQSSGTLSVHLPLATARQLGILSALNLQRRKR
ncbi:MAG: putative maturation protein [Alehxovirus pseudonemorisenecus]|uniref:Maturation protein n=1 Tax=Leviviridae sp. TaxID=2027243 RepID=A0ABY3SRZ3_9VIRU|nr:MAG: putative maturation protein [Leviviridae sp.]